MKYLIDTDVLIDHLRGRHPINPEYIKSGMHISIISYGELLYGAYKSQNSKKTLEQIDILMTDLSISVINLSEESMREFAHLKTVLEEKGTRLEDFDLLIAATSKANGFTLVTNNARHFKRVHGLLLV